MDVIRHRLESPSTIAWRNGLGNSIEVLRTALEILGIPSDACALGGMSGAAFRTYWPAPDGEIAWDADAPHKVRHDPVAAACLAYGWRLLWYRSVPFPVAWQFARQSLARGVPVLTRMCGTELHDVLVVGCAGTTTLRTLQVLSRGTNGVEEIEIDETWLGCSAGGADVGLLTAEPPHRRIGWDLAVQRSLRRAVWMADEGRVFLPPLYCSGRAAFEAAATTARSMTVTRGAVPASRRLCAAHGLAAPKDPLSAAQMGIRHCLHGWTTAQAEARRWAADYCLPVSGRFDLSEAIEGYEKEFEIWESLAALWPGVVQRSGHTATASTSLEPGEFASRREHTAARILEAGSWNEKATQAIRRSVPPMEQEIEQDLDDRAAGSEEAGLDSEFP